jgi:putative membrane protein
MALQEIAPKQDKQYLAAIGIISVLIPVVVALLLFVPQTGKLGDIDVSILPHINALLNSATAACLVVAYFFIKNRNERMHRRLMMAAFVLSSLFLVSYVVYHFQAPSTKFGDTNGDGILSEIELAEAGIMRGVYLFILLTHILLAAVVVPFVLVAFYFALSRQISRHKKIVKFTLPIWLYVAVTGVIVYLMISPYYL